MFASVLPGLTILLWVIAMTSVVYVLMLTVPTPLTPEVDDADLLEHWYGWAMPGQRYSDPHCDYGGNPHFFATKVCELYSVPYCDNGHVGLADDNTIEHLAIFSCSFSYHLVILHYRAYGEERGYQVGLNLYDPIQKRQVPWGQQIYPARWLNPDIEYSVQALVIHIAPEELPEAYRAMINERNAYRSSNGYYGGNGE